MSFASPVRSGTGCLPALASSVVGAEWGRAAVLQRNSNHRGFVGSLLLQTYDYTTVSTAHNRSGAFQDGFILLYNQRKYGTVAWLLYRALGPEG